MWLMRIQEQAMRWTGWILLLISTLGLLVAVGMNFMLYGGVSGGWWQNLQIDMEVNSDILTLVFGAAFVGLAGSLMLLVIGPKWVALIPVILACFALAAGGVVFSYWYLADIAAILGLAGLVLIYRVRKGAAVAALGDR